jgi:glycosyltransferase involved in cell wall biosynthesis
MTDDVATVIVTHNRPAMLKEVIYGELLQVVPPREIIVINNGSDPDTPQLLAGFGDRLVVRNSPGLTRDHSRNLGIGLATSTWVSLIDDDDIHHPDFLSEMSAAMADGQADLIATDYQPFDAAGLQPWQRFASFPAGYWDGMRAPGDKASWSYIGQFPIERVIVRNPFEPGQMVVRRELLLRVGAFDVDFPYSIGEMFDLNARLLSEAKLAVVWKPLLMYRRHDSNSTVGEFDSRYYKLRTFEYILAKGAAGSQLLRDALVTDIARRRRAVFAQAFASGQRQRLGELAAELTPQDWTLARRALLAAADLPAPVAAFAAWFVPRVAKRLGLGRDFNLI